MCGIMNQKISNNSSKSKYLLNFSFFQKRLNKDFKPFNQSNMGLSSNVISETSLESNHILLRKKSLLKRKSMGSLKVFYSEIIDLKLNRSGSSTLYSSIEMVFSKNGYSKHLIVLSSSDAFAVRWFYDELVVRYSLFKYNLNEKSLDGDEKQCIASDMYDSKAAKSKDLTLDDFMNQMNAEISDKRKKEISKQMKFDRCSSEER